MRPAPRKRRGRAAFTLVELLVVITIIAILISLTVGVVFLAIRRANQVQMRNDISGLEKSVIAIQTDYNVSYIPSKIRLRETMNYNPPADQLDTDSWNFLHRMWPRLQLNGSTGYTPIDWNGDGTAGDDPGGNGWVLEGQYCIVFFLGGIPTDPSSLPGGLGFSTNPANPAASGGTRKGPYFDFKTNRLNRNTSTNFCTYVDPVGGQPYAYFSSFSYWYTNSSGVPTANRYGTSDCASLNVSPYAEKLPASGSIPKYLNDKTFQIICAGANGKFGQGSSGTPAAIWTPAQAGQTAATTDTNGDATAGLDDLANFYNNSLGTAP